jgi:type 1 glutamine amidotransferase
MPAGAKTRRVHLLLKPNHAKNGAEIAWTTQYGKSPVVYLQLGQDREAYASRQFRALLASSIRWAAMRPRPVAKKGGKEGGEVMERGRERAAFAPVCTSCTM